MKRKLVRVDKYLADKKIADSRTAARRYIEEGRVTVNGQIVTKPASLIDSGSDVVLDAPEKEWVSRGAYKLIEGLDTFKLDVSGTVCVDIGASTGGFTDVLLARGAQKVYAVDVGYGQLAWKLRNDPRVVTMERTNARNLTLDMIGGRKADIIVSDASFISLRLILPVTEALLDANGFCVVLVKPQFEVGRENVGKGVVKDAALHIKTLEELADFIRNRTKFKLIDATFSPIRGPEGNIEFLFLLGFRDGDGLYNESRFLKLVKEAHFNFGMKG